MAQGKTTVYRFDKEGNISKIRALKEKDKEVHLWKRGARINYSVSKNGKVLHGASLVEGNLPSCAYCHQRIETEPRKLGIFDFHWSCFVKFHSWQRKLKVRRM